MAPCFNNVNGHMQSPDSGVCDYVQKNKTWGPSISQFFGGYLNVCTSVSFPETLYMLTRLLCIRPIGAPAKLLDKDVL